MANLRKVARQKAMKYGLDPNVFGRQIQQESGYNANAVSPAGAIGVAQIMPATAKGWGVNPRDPVAALDAAARNMAGYVKQFGSYDAALRAYNAGPGNVARSRSFGETNAYVKNILGGQSPKALAKVPRQPSVAPATTSPGADAKTQIALSLLGMGGLTGSYGGGQDPLTSALLAAQQAPSQPLPSYGSAPKAGKTIGRPLDRPGVHTGKAILSFANQVAGVYGQPIKLGTGTAHSQMTTSGNVSAHWSGNALDLPATGNQNLTIGRAALVAAGMPASQARKAKGGIYNVGGKQIIFMTHQGGDHTNHVHIGLRG